MSKSLYVFVVCFLLSVSQIYAHSDDNVRLDAVKENILARLSETLRGVPQQKPLLILIGGYVGSGKTTLSNAMKEKYGVTVFSLNSIRQAMLDEGIDIRGNKQEERNILFNVYPHLLAPCIANFQHIVIDANANRLGIEDALKFLNEHEGGDQYTVIKIHLKASEDELHRRVNARIQQPGLHQGTETDLEYELNTAVKKIYPEDYDLIINTEQTAFEIEIQIVEEFLNIHFTS